MVFSLFLGVTASSQPEFREVSRRLVIIYTMASFSVTSLAVATVISYAMSAVNIDSRDPDIMNQLI